MTRLSLSANYPPLQLSRFLVSSRFPFMEKDETRPSMCPRRVVGAFKEHTHTLLPIAQDFHLQVVETQE